MSKIDSAIHEIHKMDRLAERDLWVNKVHPLIKLVLTITYIAVTVSFSKYDLFRLPAMVVYPVAGFVMSKLSFKDCLKRIKIILPLVCFLGLFNPIFDKTQVLFLGIQMRAGWISMATLILKGVFTVLASYIFIATTSIEKICYSLRLIRVPKVMVTQIMLTYRYITVLLEEVNRITQAYSLRAPGQKGVHFRVWGSLTGQLLLRSMDRATAVFESMCLRGYNGDFDYMGESIEIRPADIIYIMVWLAIIALFRYYPVIWIIGTYIGGLF